MVRSERIACANSRETRARLMGDWRLEKTYVRPVLRLTPARKAETRTASKAKWVRRPSWVWCQLRLVMREGKIRYVAHHHDGFVVIWVGMKWVGGGLV